MQENSLWEQIGNKCLQLAYEILEKETVPTAATVETVKQLVDVAIAIDALNLQWAMKTQYGAAVLRDPLSGLRE